MKNFILTMVMTAFSVVVVAQDTLIYSLFDNQVTLDLIYQVDTASYAGDSVYVELGLYSDSFMTDQLEAFSDSLSVLDSTFNHTFNYVLGDLVEYWVLANLYGDDSILMFTDTISFITPNNASSISTIINKDKYLVEVYDLMGRVVYSCGQNRIQYGQEFNVFRQKGVFIYRYDDGTTEKRYIWVN